VSMQLDFSGEVALVTGAATGLGFAIARAFGLCGATIALNDLAEDRVEAACEWLRQESIACRGYMADVRDAGAVSALVTSIEDELEAPSVVVANAGLYPNTPFLEMSEAEWDRVIDTNLKGVFLICQAAARSMVRAGKAGRIIVVSSTAAQRAIWGWSHYCASKAAAVMLTRAMAKGTPGDWGRELGVHGIRVNAVPPGYIDVADGGRHLSLAYREGARSAAALDRPGTPEDVARGVLMLASPLADYISGAAVVIDGGASAGPVALRVVDP
jgi:3-oxoacyl-[acyl-carrier protein] reductase